MKNPFLLLALALAGVVAPLQSATITFDTAADYTGNFTNTYSTGTAPAWNAANGGTVAQYNAATGNAMSVFNTDVGSTSYTLNTDVMFTPNFGGPFTTGGSALGFGFMTNIGTNDGYTAIIRFTGTNTADFRLFKDTNVTTGNLGTQVTAATSTFTRQSGVWSTGTFYTLSLAIANTGSAISFSASVLTTGGTTLGTFSTFTDASPVSVTNTTVGVRFGEAAGDRIAIDNFSVTTSAVPEPSTVALLSGLAALGLAVYVRRRRG